MPVFLGKPLICLDEVDSTQTFLTTHTKYLSQHGLVVIAERQTGGRGRAGRSFVSPKGTLTFSLVLHPERPPNEVQVYPLFAGLAVARTVEKFGASNIRLKWPNDVLISGQKVSGILMENRMIPESVFPVLVMGIGINCCGSNLDFPEELRPKITLLSEHTKQATDRNSVLNGVLEELEYILERFDNEGAHKLLKEWSEYAKIIGTPVNYEQRGCWKKGVILEITDQGYLMIEREDGTSFQHVCGDIEYLDSPYSEKFE